jgi:hypothetical protein
MPNLIKIEFSDAVEIISEKFDNALELTDKDALVYGGAVRDMVAGLPLKGDLDIVSSYESYLITLENFRMSGKWEEEGRMGAYRRPGAHKLSAPPVYRKNKNMGRNIIFKTFGNTKVQLIQAKKKNTKDILEANLRIVKDVDIICCGLVMDVNGEIFEVLDNAHNDCLNRILRLNKFSRNLNIDFLQKRIDKLSKRGWKSRINMKRVKKMVEELEAIREGEKPSRKLGVNIQKYIKAHPHPLAFRSKVVILLELVNLLGGHDSVKRIVYQSAKKIGIDYKTSSLPEAYSIYVESSSNMRKFYPCLMDEIEHTVSIMGDGSGKALPTEPSYWKVPTKKRVKGGVVSDVERSMESFKRSIGASTSTPEPRRKRPEKDRSLSEELMATYVHCQTN